MSSLSSDALAKTALLAECPTQPMRENPCLPPTGLRRRRRVTRISLTFSR
jgi:hypothetical protein